MRLGQLKSDGGGLAPPTVYRALSALTKQERAHRLESSNAFTTSDSASASRSIGRIATTRLRANLNSDPRFAPLPARAARREKSPALGCRVTKSRIGFLLPVPLGSPIPLG
jgi:hypothetical protein